MVQFFGWAFPSSGKSQVHESGPIAFKTRFVKFPHRGETKKQPWDRILKFRFHATILGGLFQAAEKAGLTKVVKLRSKRVFSTFPILARQQKQPWVHILQYQFHATILGGLFQAAEKAGLTKVIQLRSKRVFSTFPILARQKKTAVRSNFTISVSCHHFVWAFPSSGKSRVDEGRPIAFKTRFFKFSHLGQTKKKAVRSNFTISVSCHHFVWGFPSSGKSRVDEGRPIAFKTRFFQLSQSGRSEKTALGSNFKISVSCHHFGWAFPSSGKSRVHESGPIAFKTRFVKFQHRGETKKQPWDRILKFRFHATILGGLFQAAEKAGLTKVVQLRLKRVFSTFSILARQKKQPWVQI